MGNKNVLQLTQNKESEAFLIEFFRHDFSLPVRFQTLTIRSNRCAHVPSTNARRGKSALKIRRFDHTQSGLTSPHAPQENGVLPLRQRKPHTAPMTLVAVRPSVCRKNPIRMTARAEIAAGVHRTSREDRVRAAFYRGAGLTLENPDYLRALRVFTEELLREDSAPNDLTVEAMGIDAPGCIVEIRAKEAGIAAGIDEAAWFYSQFGQSATRIAEDGAAVAPGDVLLRVAGNARDLLPLERVIVNLMQRMSGIATTTRRLVETARSASPNAHVVGTRKTPCGLLDKRAIHHGGGGTHRLSLSDAILIKTNHLRLASSESQEMFGAILRRAWEQRKSAAFFEVEVTAREEALAVARTLAELQSAAQEPCPCILMLDNFSPAEAQRAVAALRDAGLHDSVLIEASGNVSESSIADYAAAGVDAISIGALTHSVCALDLSAKLIPGAR